MIKLIGVVCIIAASICAFAGTSSAVAKAVLCTKNESPCKEANLVTHEVFNTPGTWTWPNTGLLCLNRFSLFSPWSWTILYFNCGTTIAHNECNVFATPEKEETELIKTGANKGEFKILKGETHAECTVAGIPTVNCTFSEEGWKVPITGATETSHGLINLSGMKIEKTSGKLCPKYEPLKEDKLEPETNVYVTE